MAYFNQFNTFLIMKKIFTLAVLFAAVAMVACGGQTKKANNVEAEAAVECTAECCECEECAEKACCEECTEVKECCECAECAEAPAEVVEAEVVVAE